MPLLPSPLPSSAAYIDAFSRAGLPVLRHTARAFEELRGAEHPPGAREIAAVVLADGQTLDNDEMRTWAKQRLTAYKVPRRFIKVDELPRSMLGKVLRGQVRQDLAVQ